MGVGGAEGCDSGRDVTVKYTILSFETDEKLFEWESTKGDGHVAIEGSLCAVTSGEASREMFPFACGARAHAVTFATALGSISLVVARGAGGDEAGAGRRGHRSVKSSMPGKILHIHCKEGQRVEAGQPLLTIEAMKMENEIRSPNSGVIEKIAVESGQKIETGGLLVTLAEGERTE